MTENVTLRLQDAEMTQCAGASLAQTLYAVPLTIWLTGELGTGKTTFLQAFARALGITGLVTSPTFAIEQRYDTAAWGGLLHVDLYRLSPRDAEEIVRSSDDHAGIRCIEWADRLPSPTRGGLILTLRDPHPENGRTLVAEFRDVPIPEQRQIAAWRQSLLLSSVIARHCDQVADVAVRLGEAILKRGQLVRLSALRAAGQLHDLLRFVDFLPGASHVEEEASPERSRRWTETREHYPHMSHEEAAAAFLRAQGFLAIAEIVRPHGLTLERERRVTIEQKLLYYADKRVKIDEVVSLEERLSDFTRRYAKGGKLVRSDAWYEEARRAERELFPEGAPF